MTVHDDPHDSDQTAALLRGRRPGKGRERDELDARLHLEKMRAHFAQAEPKPVHFRKWTVLRKLGQGGMGTVYLAEDPGLDRKVALKLVGDQEESSARDTAREARALAAIHHERVVQVFSVDDTSPPVVVIEMEYVDGETLRRWAAHPERRWRALVNVIAGIGDGLAELHREGLIHRDVKPDNILISSSGEGKLADFGLAVATDRAHADTPDGDESTEKATPLELRMTASGALLGTLGYIAPEVMAGDEATPRSDLFGLASVLYEGLYGTLPFAGDSPEELAEAIQRGRLSVPQDAPKLPSWLLRALRRALSADPSARYPCVADFVRALRRGLRRRRLLMIAGGLLSTIAALPVAGWYLGPPPADPCALAGAPMAALVDAVQLQDRTTAPTASLLQATLVARRDAWVDADLRLCTAERRRPLFDLQSLDRDQRRRRCLDESLGTLTALLGPSAGTASAVSALTIADLVAAIEAIPTCDDAFLAHWRPGRTPGTRTKLDAALRHELAGESNQAERLARAIADGDHPAHERAEALYRLGHVLGGERRVLEATAALENARDLAFASGHDDLYCRAAAYQAKLAANVALSPEASRRDLRAATACMERTGSRSPILRGDLLEARGLLAHAAGQLDQAIDLHRQALTLRRTRLGEHHPDVTKSHHNLGTALSQRDNLGDHHSAEEHYREVTTFWREQLASDSPPLADVLVDLGALLADDERDEEAQAHLEEALAIYERNGGEHHASLAKIHTALALIALRHRDFEVGASRLAKAREHHELTDLRRDHRDRLLRLEAEGKLAALQGNFTSAEMLFREALDLRREALSDDELDVLVDWIEAAFAVNKTPELVARALAAGPPLLDRLRAEPDAARGGALAWYAATGLQTAGRSTEAIPFLQAALAAYESHPEPPLENLAELRWELALGLAETSPAESRALAEAAHEAYRNLGDRANAASTSRWLRAHAAP